MSLTVRRPLTFLFLFSQEQLNQITPNFVAILIWWFPKMCRATFPDIQGGHQGI